VEVVEEPVLQSQRIAVFRWHDVGVRDGRFAFGESRIVSFVAAAGTSRVAGEIQVRGGISGKEVSRGRRELDQRPVRLTESDFRVVEDYFHGLRLVGASFAVAGTLLLAQVEYGGVKKGQLFLRLQAAGGGGATRSAQRTPAWAFRRVLIAGHKEQDRQDHPRQHERAPQA